MAEKDLIILLSTSANIVSRHTAFVGVDKVRLIILEKQMRNFRIIDMMSSYSFGYLPSVLDILYFFPMLISGKVNRDSLE